MSEMRKRLMLVVDYICNCPTCRKSQCADSEKLADALCYDCNMYLLKHGEMMVISKRACDAEIIDNMVIARTLTRLANDHKDNCNNQDCDIKIYEIREMIKTLAGDAQCEQLLDELGW